MADVHLPVTVPEELQREGAPPRSLLDRLLLASWVYAYAALLVIFGILKRVESGGRSARVKER